MAYLVTVPPGTVVTSEEIYPFATPAVSAIMVGIDVTAASGTSPSLQPYLEIEGTDGVWYEVWKPTAITAAGQTVATIGADEANPAVFAANARLRFEVTGTTPSFTLSVSINSNKENF